MSHWSRTLELGSGWGLRFMVGLYRLLGRRVTLGLLHPLVFWFFLGAGDARRASRQYLARAHEAGFLARPPAWRDSYRHFYRFAVSALDKVRAWLGDVDPQDVSFPDQDKLDAMRASGRGALIVGAHLGNLEMARALGVALGNPPVTAIVYTRHALRFNAVLANCNPGYAINLIQVSDIGPHTAMDLSERIERGELLFIVGDRTPPAENGRVAAARFLGHQALFAEGPMLLAALLKCPVYLFFCLEEGGRQNVYFEPFAERVILPRRERTEALQALVQRYADRLAFYCRKAPFQWFNFFDFWRS